MLYMIQRKTNSQTIISFLSFVAFYVVLFCSLPLSSFVSGTVQIRIVTVIDCKTGTILYAACMLLTITNNGYFQVIV